MDLVNVGDYVVSSHDHHAGARCVIAKVRARLSSRPGAGWRVTLADGETTWWPQGQRVWRRRFEGAAGTVTPRVRVA